jgi:hypothetical protein
MTLPYDANLAGMEFSERTLHDDRYDRPPEIFGGQTTLHTSPKRESFLLLPIVPAARSGVQVIASHDGKNWDKAR